MSFVRTLVLIAVAAGLGAWIYFVEIPKAEEQERASYILSIDPDDAASLRLAYPDGTSIAAIREGDGWKMTEPVVYPAEGPSIENFLNTVGETKIERKLDKADTGALASYGLEGERGSQARLEITRIDGKPVAAVILGITTPVGNEAFARREGEDAVFVIPLLLQSSAKKEPFELRKKTMFQTDGTGVQSVRIASPDRVITLEKRGEAQWQMLSPLEDAADNEAVRSMLDSVATIDAVSFYDGDKADPVAFGLGDAGTRFTATREDESTIAFTIGKDATDPPAGNYFERESDHQIIKAPDWVAKKFAPAPNDLRDRRLVPCKVDDVRSMTWSRGEQSFTIAREAAGKPWAITAPVAGEVLNQRIVDNVVGGLSLARADEVVGDAADAAGLASYGLDAPLVKFDVVGAAGPCASLTAAPVAPSADSAPPGVPKPVQSYYVKDAARTAVLRASEHEYSRIAMKRSEFTSSAPTDPDAAE